jgi:hypothetical protein
MATLLRLEISPSRRSRFSGLKPLKSPSDHPDSLLADELHFLVPYTRRVRVEALLPIDGLSNNHLDQLTE